jgi:F0F1-type ATP synthase assembly protein I
MKTPLPAAVAPWSLVVATLLGTVVGIVSACTQRVALPASIPSPR